MRGAERLDVFTSKMTNLLVTAFPRIINSCSFYGVGYRRCVLERLQTFPQNQEHTSCGVVKGNHFYSCLRPPSTFIIKNASQRKTAVKAVISLEALDRGTPPEDLQCILPTRSRRQIGHRKLLLTLR